MASGRWYFNRYYCGIPGETDAEFKKALSKRYRNDIAAYVDGETEFIVQILAIYGLGGLDEIRTANKR